LTLDTFSAGARAPAEREKHAVIEWSPYKKADLVSNAIIKMLKPYRDHVKLSRNHFGDFYV